MDTATPPSSGTPGRSGWLSRLSFRITIPSAASFLILYSAFWVAQSLWYLYILVFRAGSGIDDFDQILLCILASLLPGLFCIGFLTVPYHRRLPKLVADAVFWIIATTFPSLSIITTVSVTTKLLGADVDLSPRDGGFLLLMIGFKPFVVSMVYSAAFSGTMSQCWRWAKSITLTRVPSAAPAAVRKPPEPKGRWDWLRQPIFLRLNIWLTLVYSTVWWVSQISLIVDMAEIGLEDYYSGWLGAPQVRNAVEATLGWNLQEFREMTPFRKHPSGIPLQWFALAIGVAFFGLFVAVISSHCLCRLNTLGSSFFAQNDGDLLLECVFITIVAQVSGYLLYEYQLKWVKDLVHMERLGGVADLDLPFSFMPMTMLQVPYMDVKWFLIIPTFLEWGIRSGWTMYRGMRGNKSSEAARAELAKGSNIDAKNELEIQWDVFMPLGQRFKRLRWNWTTVAAVLNLVQCSVLSVLQLWLTALVLLEKQGAKDSGWRDGPLYRWRRYVCFKYLPIYVVLTLLSLQFFRILLNPYKLRPRYQRLPRASVWVISAMISYTLYYDHAPKDYYGLARMATKKWDAGPDAVMYAWLTRCMGHITSYMILSRNWLLIVALLVRRGACRWRIVGLMKEECGKSECNVCASRKE